MAEKIKITVDIPEMAHRGRARSEVREMVTQYCGEDGQRGKARE